MTFAHPLYLLLLLLLVPVIAWYVWKRNAWTAKVTFSSLEAFRYMKRSPMEYLRHLPFVLRMLAIACVIVAIARPQRSDSWRNHSTEGIDIVLTLDISGSMLAQDLKPDRLEAAKRVATEFVNNRPNDNVALVAFSGQSFTQCPLTINHAELINLMTGLKSGMIEDGTAIGSGLATSVNRLRDSQAKSKVIILLTDGSNNRGEIAPITAGEIAKSFGIRVYTIGVGSQGEAPYPFKTPYGIQYQNIPVEIDEATLQSIADITGGKYFRAVDNKSLRAIYEEIDQLEKTKILVHEYSRKEELYHWFILAALLLLIAEVALRNTVFRSIP